MFLPRLNRIAAATVVTAVAAVAVGSLAPLRGLAQGAPAAQAGAGVRPATERDVSIYVQMGAVNVCVLSAQKVGLDKSLPAATESIVFVLNGAHGGVIQGANNNQKLTPNQLANGTVFQMVPRIKQLCYDKLASEDKKKVDDVMGQIDKVIKQNKK